MANKYNQMSKLLIEVIAKRAKSSTQTLMLDQAKIKDKIRENPQNIEKLTEIEDFMKIVPNDLNKMNKEI